MDLVAKYKQLLSGVQHGLSQVGNAVGTAVHNEIQAAPQQLSTIGNFVAHQPFVQIPGVGITPRIQSPTIGQYTQGQIVNPIAQGLQNITHGNLVNRAQGALSVLGGGVSATPAGALYNIGAGALSGLGQSIRTGSPLASTIQTNMSQPTSLAQQGLGIKNPLLAMGIDVLAGNPKAPFTAIKNVKSLGKLAIDTGAMHPEDANIAQDAIDYLKSATSMEDYQAPHYQKAIKTLKDLAEHYGGKSLAKQPLPTIMQEMENRIAIDSGYHDFYYKRGLVGQQQPGSLPLDNPLPFGNEKSPSLSIPTDVATQQQAEFKTMAGNGGKGGFQGLDPQVRQGFQDWVNARRATKIEDLAKKTEFSDLNNKGLNGILEFQAGNKTGRYGDLKQFFDNKYKEYIAKTGDKLGYHEDYLPGLWANSPEQIQQVFGRTLGLHPSFTQEKIIKDYKTGIAAGLTPRFQTLGELAGWYEGKVNKAIADHQFFNQFSKDGLFQPATKAPRDWVTLNPDRFPKISVNVDGTEYRGTYKAPPELANVVNNYLQDAQFKGLANIADYVSRAKNITLSFGIPYTGINAHGVNILARHTLFGTGGNPITRFLTGAQYMLHPASAAKALTESLSTAPRAVKAGLTLSGEEHTALLNEGESVAKSLGKRWNQAFETPLFNKMIPSMKLSSFNELVKNGMKDGDAAKLVNNVYGGINWEQMGRSRDMQNLLRSVVLAPDWAESGLKLGGNIAKSVTPWGGANAARYRTMGATFLGSLVALNVANKLSSGHYAYQNDPGHTFELETGYTSDGQKRYLRPYGTAVDFARLPFDIAAGLAQGDPTSAFRAISNRLSIPLGSALHLLTNTNYKGQAIYGRDKYGNDIPPMQAAGGIGTEAGGLVGFPSFAGNAIDYATGKQGGEQALTQGLELPFRYQGPGNSGAQKQVGAGLSGQALYDAKKAVAGQSKFSPNQMQYIQQGGQGAVNDLLQLRQNRQQINAAKKSGQQSTNTNQAFAAESSQLDPQQQKVAESLAKTRVELHGGETTVGTKTFYRTPDGVKSIDVTPPTKGQGIDAYTNQNWQYSKARDVYKSTLSDGKKQELLKQLGVTPAQAEYDYKATHSTDVKTQYITGQNLDHQELLKQMVKGRVVSVSGTQFASNAVIDNLQEQGYLSDAEAKALKAIKVTADGRNLVKTKAGRMKRVKGIKLSIPKAKKITVKGPKKVKVKQYKLKSVKLKA